MRQSTIAMLSVLSLWLTLVPIGSRAETGIEEVAIRTTVDVHPELTHFEG